MQKRGMGEKSNGNEEPRSAESSNLHGLELALKIALWRRDVCVLQCFPVCSLFLLSQMPLWAWWMAGTTVRGALRSTTMGVGAQSVITPGTSMMPQLCAGSWTVALQFQHQEMPILDKAQAQFTWTMCSARGTSRPSLSAGAVAGAFTAVTTLRMPVWSAQVPLIVLPKSCYLGWWIGPTLPGMGMSWSHVCSPCFAVLLWEMALPRPPRCALQRDRAALPSPVLGANLVRSFLPVSLTCFFLFLPQQVLIPQPLFLLHHHPAHLVCMWFLFIYFCLFLYGFSFIFHISKFCLL